MGYDAKGIGFAANIAPSTMGSYVQNTREPDFATLKSLAAYFRVSIDYLLDYHTNQTVTAQGAELLRIFRSLPPFRRDICVGQCRVFACMDHKEKEKKST